MSNLGLGNLITLKRHLLSASMVAQSDYDTIITEIGRGVAAQFDKFCNRKFERIAGDKAIFPADRRHYYLPRFPVETVTSVEQKDGDTEGWITLTDAIENRDDASGLIFFGAVLGYWWSQIRVTYTGGFWFDTAETENTAQPAGSTLLPHDISLAWKLQSSHLWDQRDKIGISIASDPGKVSSLAQIELIPQVKQILQGYIRYQIT